MFKVILSAICALGLGSVAFANDTAPAATPSEHNMDAGAHDKMGKMDKGMKKAHKPSKKKKGETAPGDASAPVVEGTATAPAATAPDHK